MLKKFIKCRINTDKQMLNGIHRPIDKAWFPTQAFPHIFHFTQEKCMIDDMGIDRYWIDSTYR